MKCIQSMWVSCKGTVLNDDEYDDKCTLMSEPRKLVYRMHVHIQLRCLKMLLT